MATWFDENAPVERTPTLASAVTGQDVSGIPGGEERQALPGTTSGPGQGDPQAYFQTLIQGLPGTPQSLLGLEPQLAQAGIKVLRNARGTAGKIQLPNGEIIDVIVGADTGGQGWAWQPGPGSGGGMPGGAAYQMGTYTGGGKYPLASVMGPGLMQPWTTPFQAPTDVTQQNDPGWQFRMREGLKAIERSAAARGTLLTGGTLKALNRFGQDYASNEYDKVYGRALGEYQQAYNIFNQNQGNQFGRLAGVAGMGQNAASLSGAGAQNFGQAGAGLLTDIGNAQAAGQMGSANAWANAINNLGLTAQQYATLAQLFKQPKTPPPTPQNQSAYRAPDDPYA